LERDFLELVRDAGLSDPQCNVIVDDELVDFFWPAHNLVVEVDGFLFHRTRRPFEDDRRRDAKHAVAGRLVLRVTERRMKYDRRQLTGDLSKLLSP
jgi:very-short-patch-repair endonuclease